MTFGDIVRANDEVIDIDGLKVQNKDYILGYKKKLGEFIAANYEEKNNKFLN